jgi:hypothetical protein
VILGLLGAAVLVLLGARTLWSAFRIRLGEGAEPISPRRGFPDGALGDGLEPADDRLLGGDLLGGERAGAAGSVRAPCS